MEWLALKSSENIAFGYIQLLFMLDGAVESIKSERADSKNVLEFVVLESFLVHVNFGLFSS